MSTMQKEKNNFVNNKRQKNTVFYILIILLVLLVIASSAVVILAWAKYQTGVNGTATAQVAKWSFKLVDGVPETSDVIDFAVTRTDTNTKVAEGKLAPGTYGKFEIGIDARGTETILEYLIDVALVNKPTNLKFYSDSERTKEIKVTGNKMTIKGFMSLEDVKEIRTETIYWEWPYTIGTTETEIEKNDVIDTQDAGKTMTMSITVTGTEVLEEPKYLADLVQIGDTVNYNANVTDESGNAYTITPSSSETGYSTTTFSSADSMTWKVVNIKENGEVELMAITPKTIYFSNVAGYNNAPTILGKIAEIYGHGYGAVGTRSMTVEDIDKYTSFDKTKFGNSYSSTGYYGGTRSYSFSSSLKYPFTVEGAEIGTTSDVTISTSGTYTVPQTAYQYQISNYKKSGISDSVYSMLTAGNYWLASRYCYLYSSYCCLGVCHIESGFMIGNYLFASDGDSSKHTKSVAPVVSLKSDIQTSGKVNGVWQLE